jgi:Holliday junction resolvasome RuvABC endonuclease subunit
MKPEGLPGCVVGLDLSIRKTGIAHADGSVSTFEPTAEGDTNLGLDRLCEVRDHVLGAIPRDIELVMMEGLAFDAHDTSRQLAQLTGIIRAALFDRRVPFIAVAPSTLKKYATGSGRSGKAEVMKQARLRLGYEDTCNDESDALWLRAIGCDLLQVPLVEMPARNREALAVLARRAPVRQT